MNLDDILHDLGRADRALSEETARKIAAEKYGVRHDKHRHKRLFEVITGLRFRTALEMLDDICSELYDELILLIGKADPIVRVPVYFAFSDTPIDPNNVIFTRNIQVIENSPEFTIDFTQASIGKYIAFSQPIAEPPKTKWFNTEFNRGNSIPDATFKSPATVGNYKTVVSRDAFIFQATIYNITFSS